MSHKILVGSTEMVIAEESPVCRERRRVRRLQHQMFRAVDKLTLALGISPPQDKDEMLPLLGQAMYHRIGKTFPPPVLVRTGLMSPHRECGIEQQNSLVGPTGKIAAHGYGRTYVVVNFLENVLPTKEETAHRRSPRNKGHGPGPARDRGLDRELPPSPASNGQASKAANISRPGG